MDHRHPLAPSRAELNEQERAAIPAAAPSPEPDADRVDRDTEAAGRAALARGERLHPPTRDEVADDYAISIAYGASLARSRARRLATPRRRFIDDVAYPALVGAAIAGAGIASLELAKVI